MEKWARANYQPNLPLMGRDYVTASQTHIDLSRTAAEEGMVLLKNNHDLLPLSPGIPVALFGKATIDYVKGGGGSGDVHCPYVRTLCEALRMGQYAASFAPLDEFYRQYVQQEYGKGALPGMIAEPALPDDLLDQAAAFTETAIISISRFSGEGWDRSDVDFQEPNSPYPQPEKTMPQIAGEIFPRGDFYLTAEEETLIHAVTGKFPKVVVVLNTGGVIDTSWIKRDDSIGAALLAWQGGMEGSVAAANILFGKVNPSGKLPDTFAGRLEDYPSSANFHESPHYVDYTEDIYVGYRYFSTIPGASDKVCYPFGYGLSYTTFEITFLNGTRNGAALEFDFRVTNTGKLPGKEVLQLYVSAPQGKLGKPAYSLAGFRKTTLLAPGDSECIHLTVPVHSFASFDDLGAIAADAWVLERGSHRFFYGSGLHNLAAADFCWNLDEDQVLEICGSKLAPTSLSKRLLADGSYQALPMHPANDPDDSIIPKMPGASGEGIRPAQRGYDRRFRGTPVEPGIHPLADVAEGGITLDAFMDQLTDDDLIHLLGGQPNTGVANTFGLGNLPEYGIPNIMTADGPAGVRINPETGIRTTAFPCGTLLSSTWNPDIVRRVGAAGGAELKENNLAMWLTPAVNIHRNPYCGRNFEYYSEDPFLVGAIGAAMIQGIQSNNTAACVKHFAVNNKEINRKNSDSRLSKRALREIYLKGFEIIVKTADPWSLMTSYNIINGWRASECADLLTGILREEWGFRGVIVTDWWNRAEQYKEILAGNDVKMGTGYPERVRSAMVLGALTRKELLPCAKRVLELILKID